MSTLEFAKKRMARWRILRILYTGRPYPVGEGLIAEVMTDADLAMTVTEIRTALQYLADKGYVRHEEVTIPGEGRHWEAEITANGTDYVEYAVADDPGIHRPARE